MTKFRMPDRLTANMFPARIDEWITEDHLARFVVDIIDRIDLSTLENKYRGTGSEPYHPSLMLSLIFYGYSTGIFSSRKLENASYELIPVRYICGNLHPDHTSIANFRKSHIAEIGEIFKQILLIAHEMQILKLGTVVIDGSKIKANASKHKALSWEYANKIEKQIKEETQQLLELADKADKEDKTPEMDIPEELKRRETRLKRIATAKAEIEARAKARYEEEKNEYDLKIKARKDKENKGEKPRGKEPKHPEPGPKKTDQVNLTDEESRIMLKSGGGFEQAYNAQATVDAETMIILTNHLTQNTNDKKELIPALETIGLLPTQLGKPDKVLADSGYYSENNINSCNKHKIIPLIAYKRDHHNTYLADKTKDKSTSEKIPENPSLVEQMKIMMQTKEGKELYARRKSTIEPTFGIIKHVMGFKQFLLRGIKKVSGEWDIVCTSYNLKRIHSIIVST